MRTIAADCLDHEDMAMTTREQAHQLVNTLPGSGLEIAERLFALPLSAPATASPAQAQAPMDDPPVPTCFMTWSHDPRRDHRRKRYATSD